MKFVRVGLDFELADFELAELKFADIKLSLLKSWIKFELAGSSS